MNCPFRASCGWRRSSAASSFVAPRTCIFLSILRFPCLVCNSKCSCQYCQPVPNDPKAQYCLSQRPLYLYRYGTASLMSIVFIQDTKILELSQWTDAPCSCAAVGTGSCRFNRTNFLLGFVETVRKDSTVSTCFRFL